MTQTTTLASGPRADIDDVTETRERRRFRVAMWLSAFSHALVIVVLYLLWQPVSEEQAPLPPIPITVIQEKEGQSGAAGGGNSETAASSASAASTQESASEPAASTAESEPELRQPTPPIETPPQPSSEVPSLAQTQTTPAPAPQETVEPVPQHKPSPPKPPKPHTETAETTPTTPTTQPAAQQPATATQTPTQTASASGTDQPLPPGTGGRGRGDEGAGRAAVGNGSLEGPGDDYLDAVRRWVQRYRKYPDEAVKQKQEGVVQLGFKFARDGTVTDAWIEKSSGFPLLDQAALNMIHAASPIPKVPDRYKGDTLTLVMPENFRIGLFDRLFH